MESSFDIYNGQIKEEPMKYLINKPKNVPLLFLIAIFFVQSCKQPKDEAAQQAETVQAEILHLQPSDAVIKQAFPAMLQGKDNIQIRPQISGYIDNIFVDEGAYVKAGQSLFHINASMYREQKNTAMAALSMAKSQLESAQLELDKYKVLSDNNVWFMTGVKS